LPARATRFTEPRIEGAPYGIEDRANRPCLSLHEVDVLGVAPGLLEEELVERGAATERKSFPDQWVVENLDERA
jgi:hypothetical protein